MARSEPVRLRGVAWGDRNVATSRISEALRAAGASITDVHFFSGVQTVLTLTVPPQRAPALGRSLTDAELVLDGPSRELLDRAVGTDELEATLTIVFPEGDPGLRRDVPDVPG